MDKLPPPGPVHRRKPRLLLLLALIIPLACLLYLNFDSQTQHSSNAAQLIENLNVFPASPPNFHKRTVSDRHTQHFSRASGAPKNAGRLIDKCSTLSVLPAPSPDFNNRTVSDRYDPPLTPKKPILIRNATIWTGETAEGSEIIVGDVLLEKGIIRSVGSTEDGALEDVEEIDVNGAWVTPGIVDLHSHMGVGSVPGLTGSTDINSGKGFIQPWLRSFDGLNTHDEAYRLSSAGGVTSAMILPGSANAIGALLASSIRRR